MGKTEHAGEAIRSKIQAEIDDLLNDHMDAIMTTQAKAEIQHATEGNDKPLKFPIGFRTVIWREGNWHAEVTITYGVRVKEKREIEIREADMIDLMTGSDN